MEQQDPGQDLLNSIIADIATMEEPLPGPTKEDIASIVLHVQIQYLQNKVTKLETEVRELREENTDLRDENSILRFENDALLRLDSTGHASQTASPIIPETELSDLIDLGPEEYPTLAALKVEEDKSLKPKLGRIISTKDIEQQATFQPETQSPDRKQNHKMVTPGREKQLIFIDDDEGSPPRRHPSHSNDRSITLHQHTLKTIQKHLCNAAESDKQNTSIILAGLPEGMNYAILFRAIAHIRPGKVKQVHIREHTASITFFTRYAADRLYDAVKDRESQVQKSQFYGVSVSWSSKPVPPEDSKGRTRVLGVEGHPDVVTVASVIGAMRWQGFNPQMEVIGLLPWGSFLRQNSWILGPPQQVVCRFRSVRDAEMAEGLMAKVFAHEWRVQFGYLPDPCE